MSLHASMSLLRINIPIRVPLHLSCPVRNYARKDTGGISKIFISFKELKAMFFSCKYVGRSTQKEETWETRCCNGKKSIAS